MSASVNICDMTECSKMTKEECAAMCIEKGCSDVETAACLSKYDENGNLTEFRPANSVIGYGEINTKPIVVYGDDFTVRGGAADAAIWEKMICSEKFANEYCLPLIRLIEGTGGGGSIKSLEDSGYSYVPFNPGWDIVVNNLSKIPVISIAMGPVAGLGAARLVSSHYSIMIKEQSQIFVAGPPLVKRIGEKKREVTEDDKLKAAKERIAQQQLEQEKAIEMANKDLETRTKISRKTYKR